MLDRGEEGNAGAGWLEAPLSGLATPPGEVHLWRVRLDVPPPRAGALAAVLSPEEQRRAARFHAARDALRFTVAHGALRLLLSRYAGVAPRDLRFASGPAGKPSLVGAQAIEFNLTHAGGLALCAVAAAAVGVDVEPVRAGFDDVAGRYFTIRERVALAAAPPGERDATFFRYWTLKEAYLKLTGSGLSTPLDSFEAVPAGAAASVLSTRDGATLCAHLRTFHPEPGYVAALASAHAVGVVRRWDGDALAPTALDASGARSR